jgi:DNA polymerase-3 subunit alpha
MGFVHLRVYSDYSLGLGTIKIKDLVKRCVKEKYPAVAITDKNNLCASLEFSLEATKAGIQPIIGLAMTVAFGKNSFGEVLLYAMNAEGYKNLLKISTESYLKRGSNKDPHISKDFLFAHKSGLIILSCGINSLEKALFTDGNLQTPLEIIQELKAVYPQYRL